jgi:hypothetical protein
MAAVDMLSAAMEYAGRGWYVFPCRWQGEHAKAPLTQNGFKNATRDPDQIRRWWTRWPHAMIGAPVDRRLVVLDVDPRHGGDVRALLGGLGIEHAGTLVCESGRGDGGTHLYYLRPGGDLAGTGLPEGIDLRVGGRHYVIVPPSIHPATGQPYRWRDPSVKPAPLPGQIRDAIRRKVAPIRPMVRRGDGKGLVDFVAAQQPNNRNEGLFWAAMKAGEEGVLAELSDDLVAAAVSAGLSRLEAERTVDSARRRTLQGAS